MNPRAFKYKHKDLGNIYWREKGNVKFKSEDKMIEHTSLLDLKDLNYMIKEGIVVKIN